MFVRVPLAPVGSVALTVKVASPPTARFTVVAMLPLPLAAVHDEPAEAAQLHVTPVSVAGSVSATVAPVTGFGPALLTTMVYVIGPAPRLVAPSVLVIPRFAGRDGVTKSDTAVLVGKPSGEPAYTCVSPTVLDARIL